MTTLKIYGKPSYTYEFIKSSIEKLINSAELPIQVQEIQDTSEFIDNEILKIPSVEFNGEVKSFANCNITSFSKSVNQWILKKAEYGKMTKIIVPIDYSESSENALAYAVGLGRKTNNPIELMHCYSPRGLEVQDQYYVDPKLEESEEYKFDEYTSNMNETWLGDKGESLLMDSEFRVGFPGTEIIEKSKSDKDQLIILGSTGEQGYSKKMFGSVSTVVAQKSESPTLIIPPKATYKPYKNVLYCCNDLALDALMVDRALDFIRADKPEVHLVHVENNTQYDHPKLLNVWKEFYDGNKIRFANLIAESDQNVLNGYCEKYNIDLIIIARPNRGFFSKLFHKSFTKEMAIYSNTPLLIINKNKNYD